MDLSKMTYSFMGRKDKVEAVCPLDEQGGRFLVLVESGVMLTFGPFGPLGKGCDASVLLRRRRLGEDAVVILKPLTGLSRLACISLRVYSDQVLLDAWQDGNCSLFVPSDTLAVPLGYGAAVNACVTDDMDCLVLVTRRKCETERETVVTLWRRERKWRPCRRLSSVSLLLDPPAYCRLDRDCGVQGIMALSFVGGSGLQYVAEFCFDSIEHIRTPGLVCGGECHATRIRSDLSVIVGVGKQVLSVVWERCRLPWVAAVMRCTFRRRKK